MPKKETAGGWLFGLFGALMAVGYATTLFVVRSDRTMTDFAAISCLWGASLWLSNRIEPSRALILAGAVVFRLLMLPTPGNALAFKLVIVAFDLATVWLLSRLAGQGARGTLVLLAYAWNPLVIKEFAGSAHIDAALVCLLLAAVTAAESIRGGLLLGVAALVNPVALLFTPAFFRRAGWKALPGPAAAIVLLPWIRPQGLLTYAEKGPFNAAVFQLLPENRPIAIGLGAAVLLGILIYWFRKDDGTPAALFRQAIWILGAFLLLTPTFAPWHLTWLLPFAAFELSWFWLALSGTILNQTGVPALMVAQFAIPAILWFWITRGRRAQTQEIADEAPPDKNLILRLASLAGLAGGLCCVTPVVLVMAGLASVSSAAAFGNMLYGDYRWAFRLFGMAVLSLMLIRYFRKGGVCSLDQVKRRRNWIVNVTLLAFAGSTTVYVFWTYIVVHYWGIAAGLPWAQYDESWAIPVAGILLVTTAVLFLALGRSRTRG